MDQDLFEQIRIYLPKYLTPANKEELYEELRAFPNFKSYYLNDKKDEQLLQGDGWRGFIAINFLTREARECSGVVISNSCDIDISNVRYRDRNILFAPLVDLKRFRELLLKEKNAEQVNQIIESIKLQRITDILYLPESSELAESLILLDDVRPQPLSDFVSRGKYKLFALSQVFFYLFILKLAIHFTRFQEDTARFN